MSSRGSGGRRRTDQPPGRRNAAEMQLLGSYDRTVDEDEIEVHLGLQCLLYCQGKEMQGPAHIFRYLNPQERALKIGLFFMQLPGLAGNVKL